MKALILALALALPTVASHAAERIERGNLLMENVPEPAPALVERVMQYGNMRSAAFADWQPDGKGLLISTRFADAVQLHAVRQALGMRQQLTFASEPISFGRYQPGAASQGFLYSKDSGGDENHQLYFYEQRSGRSLLLTDGKSRNQSAIWAPSGRFILYSSTRRDGVNFDIWRHDPDSDQTRMVYQAQGSFAALDIAPDERFALLKQNISATESRLYLLDLGSGVASAIDVGASRVAFGDALFARDGARIFLTLDTDSEFQRLAEYEIATGRLRILTPDQQWDVEQLSASPDGQWLAWSVNEGGMDRIYLRNQTDGSVRPGPQLPPAVLGRMAFSPDSNQLALSYSAANQPGDVYVFDLRSDRLRRWTESETAGLASEEFVTPELVQFPTFDQQDGAPRQIPAFVYRARNVAGKAPVVISIHGGPEAQYRPQFSDMAQLLAAEMGVAFIAPNVRGSSGYGKTWLELDNGFLREDSVKDIGALLDWIATQPDLDASRVLVMGGSYGGYMTLASLVHYSARLRGGIDIVGISHFVTFLNNTKGYRQDLRRVEYGDERDPEMRQFLEQIAPLNNAARISVPLFVVQGLNDPRVPVSEAEQIVARVRGNGNEVWYLLAKDEGHGFRKKGNRDFYTAAALNFIRKQLIETADAAVPAGTETAQPAALPQP